MAGTQPLSPEEQLQYAILSGNPALIAQKQNVVNTGSALTPEQKAAAIKFDASSSDPGLQAQAKVLQGQGAPSGYHIDSLGNAVKNPSFGDKLGDFVGKYGWAVPLVAAGGIGLAGLAGGAGASAIPSIATTTGLPSTAGIGTSVGALSIPGAAATAIPSIATTTGLASTTGLGTDVTAAGTSLPSSGGMGSMLSKIVNPKSLAQNAIKDLTQKQSSNASQQQPQQVPTTQPTPTPNNSLASVLSNLTISPNTSMPTAPTPEVATGQVQSVSPNTRPIQNGMALGQQDPYSIFQQMLNRYGQG